MGHIPPTPRAYQRRTVRIIYTKMINSPCQVVSVAERRLYSKTPKDWPLEARAYAAHCITESRKILSMECAKTLWIGRDWSTVFPFHWSPKAHEINNGTIILYKFKHNKRKLYKSKLEANKKFKSISVSYDSKNAFYHTWMSYVDTDNNICARHYCTFELASPGCGSEMIDWLKNLLHTILGE